MSVDASAVARVLGIDVVFQDLRAGGILFLPQRIAVFAQASTVAQAAPGWSSQKYQATSAAQAGARDGFGSPIHLALLELLPPNGDGVGSVPVTVYPLEDGYEATTAAGSITPTGTQTVAGTYRVRAGGILGNEFTVAAGASVATRVAAITASMNGVLAMPLIATDSTTVVDVDAKWAGPTGNDIELEVISTGSGAGGAFTIVQPTGGTVDPDITDALDQMGN